MDLGQFHVEGWEPLVQLLQERTDVAYVSVCARDGRDGEENLGRFPEPGQGDLSDLHTDPVTVAQDWIKDVILRYCVGEARTRLRVYVYGPKGERRSSASLVVVSRQDHMLTTANLSAQEVLQRIAMVRADREEKQLATHVDHILVATKQLADIALNLAQGIGQHYQGALVQLGRELEATRKQSDRLVESIVEHRIDHAAAQAARMMEEGRKAQEDKRLQITEQLGKQALEQMGGLVGLFAAHQTGMTIDPQLQPLLAAVKKNASLLDALKDPAVHALLDQPGAGEALARFIQTAAQQAQTNPSSETKK